jgi:hypothetical protein
MKITALTGVLVGIGALVLHGAAQEPTCSGKNIGIDLPGWKIEYA